MEHVVVERLFAEPIQDAQLAETEERSASCLSIRNARHLCSYLSADRRRMICVFEAPDSESIRAVQDEVGLPFERVWTASVFESQ